MPRCYNFLHAADHEPMDRYGTDTDGAMDGWMDDQCNTKQCLAFIKSGLSSMQQRQVGTRLLSHGAEASLQS